MNSVLSLDRRAAVRLSGAVYTPSSVAEAVVRIARSHLRDGPLKVLEPSVGDGAFLGQLALLMPDDKHVAIDIDEHVVGSLRQERRSWPPATQLISKDFLCYACESIAAGEPRFDLIIGNPPFIRKHNFSGTFKASVARLAELTGASLPALKNSWAAFLLASSRLVTDNGVVAFVLPYELITVSYGQQMLAEMAKVFLCIDLFISDEKAFPTIDQDAIVFVGRRTAPDRQGLYVHRVKTMSSLDGAVRHKLTAVVGRSLSLELNAFLIDPAVMPMLRRAQEVASKFVDLARSAPGIVTAANDFFILREADVEANGLQNHVLPILKKQSIIDRSPVFSWRDFEALSKRDPCKLLHIKGDFDSLHADVQRYIKKGAEAGFSDRYKCRGRKNWYEVRLVPPAAGFFFKRSHGYPRICVNEAGIYTTDTAYGIHPREGYTMRGICYSFYNSLTMLFAETNGRFYGGGVLELSPNELKDLPIVYHEPTDDEFESFLAVHRKAGNDAGPILDYGDRWLASHPLMRDLDVAALRKAWAAVRAHRLRHSNRPKMEV